MRYARPRTAPDAMSHADSHFVASRLVTVAAFAVCVRVTIRLISCKHESSVCFHVHARLIATRKKIPALFRAPGSSHILTILSESAARSPL